LVVALRQRGVPNHVGEHDCGQLPLFVTSANCLLHRFSSAKKFPGLMASSPAKVSGSADRCAVDPTQGRRAAMLCIGLDPLKWPVTVQCDSGLTLSRRLVPRPWRAV